MEGGYRDERKEKLRERKLQREEKQTNTVELGGEKENTIRKVKRRSGEPTERGESEPCTGSRKGGNRRERARFSEEERGGDGGPQGRRKESSEGGRDGWRGGIMRVAERRVLTTKPPGMDKRSQKTPSGSGQGGGRGRD